MKLTEEKLYLLLIGIVILVSGLALFNEVMEPDGALYASIAKNIILRNNWLSLYVHGTDWLDKPHLPFWITAVSFKLFGISAFAYKLPSFLISLLGTWYLYCFAKDIYDKKTAIISSLIFLTSLHVLISTSDVRAEGYLTAFIMAAIYHYYKAQQKPMPHIIAGSFFAACAVMVKGIFVLAPIFGGFIVYWILSKNNKQLLKPKWWIAILLILIFISPELYALYIQFDIHPEKTVFDRTGVSGLKFFFWDSQFGRFFNTGPIKGKGDLSFFLHTTLWAFLPWSILFYTAVIQFFKKTNRSKFPLTTVIIFTSATITFLLFSLSKFQLPHYILVIFPQFAMITALYLRKLQGKSLKTFLIVQNILFIIIVILLITIAACLQFKNYPLIISGLLLISFIAFLIVRGSTIQTIVVRNTILSIGIMAFLYVFFYPSLLTYQAGMQAGKWLNEHYPKANISVFRCANSFAFDLYSKGEPKYLYSNTDLEEQAAGKNMIIFTCEQALPELKSKYKLSILKDFNNYRITKLKVSFVNYKTRFTVLEHFYLVKINSINTPALKQKIPSDSL